MMNSLQKRFPRKVCLKLLILSISVLLTAHFVTTKIFLTLIAFFAASVANATAIGGGFLFMPLFIFIYKLAPIAALKLSIATQAFGMTSGALTWGRRYIEKPAFIVGSIASIFGVCLATYVWVVPSSYIKPLFAVISLGVFIALVVEMKLKLPNEKNLVDFKLNYQLIGFCLSAFAGGLITGWTAIGVGEVVALYLLFFYRLSLDIAIGTGVAVLAVSSMAGFLFHMNLGGIPWELLVFTVPGVILGGRYGVKFAKHLEQSVSQSSSEKIVKKSPLKLVFAMVILIDCIVILLFELLQ